MQRYQLVEHLAK